MSMIDIAYALTAPVEAMMFFLLFDTFFERRKLFARWQFVAGIVALAVMIRIVNLTFLFELGNLIGIVISMVIVSAFFYRSVWYQRLLVPLLIWVVLGAIEIIVMNLLLVVFNITAVEIVSIPAYLVMGIILSKAIGFALCYAIWMKHSGVDIEVGKAYWILFLFLFSSSALATFLIYWMLYALNDTMYSGAALICTISLFISTFFALYLYARSQRYYQTIRYQEQAEQQMRAQLRHMDEIILKQNELRAMRHDMNSHLIALKSYFDKKDFEGGERYITGLNLQFLHTSLVISSGNHALDAVLNAKKTLAESKGIKFLYNLRIQEELPMDPKDLCIIFANALDNAIEACERLSDDEEKKISLVLLQDNATLFCKIANTTSSKQSDSLETSKDDRINHGFGVKNIRKALEKYQAMVNFEKTNNEFIFSFSCYI